MRLKIISTFLIALLVGGVAAGQNKVSGTAQCAKPDQQHAIEVGDRPNHSFAISQGKCSWTKPLEISGMQSKEDVGSGFAEISGNNSRDRGYVVITWANGDKSFVRTQGNTTLKDGVPQNEEGKWIFAGGTGKLKGLKGSGTYKCTFPGDGNATCDIEGEYKLPTK